MEINIYNKYGEIDFDYNLVVSDVSNYFKGEKVVSLILVSLEEIHSINLQYRAIDRPTDVISFENQANLENEEDESYEDMEDQNYLGDIFISIDKVYEQALSYGHSKEREFAFLLVHGLLHLQGYDHLNENDEKVMFAKQEEILNEIKYTRNE